MVNEYLAKYGESWKNHYKAHKNSIATGMFICKKKEANQFLSGPCHVFLANRPHEGDILAVFSGLQQSQMVSKELLQAETQFIAWLLNISPFKEAFLTMTVKEALDYRVLIGDVKAQSNLMGAGLMATRVFNEHPRIFLNWWSLVKEGLHPTVAFAFAHKVWFSPIPKAWGPRHTGCFDSKFDTEDLYNFLQKRVVADVGSYEEYSTSSIQSFRLWRTGIGKAPTLFPIVEKIVAKIIYRKPLTNVFMGGPIEDTSGTILRGCVKEVVKHLKPYEEWVK